MAIRVGDLGRTDTELRPHGFVTVRGERRDARVLHGTVPPGAVVAVVTGDPLGLIVQPVHDHPPAFPDHGQPVRASFAECHDATTDQSLAETDAAVATSRRRGLRATAGVGVGSAVAAAAWRWDDLPAWGDEPLVTAAALVLAGGLLGAASFHLLDRSLGRSDPGLRPVAPLSVGLGLMGAFATAAGCLPHVSLSTALAAAAVAGVLLAAAPLGLLAAGGGDG